MLIESSHNFSCDSGVHFRITSGVINQSNTIMIFNVERTKNKYFEVKDEEL
jgi:hypothetical protein